MIELISLIKQRGERCVLKETNISFNRNELTVITGPSGAGKSTLLNLIGGLDYPTGGQLLYDGNDVSGDLCEYRAKSVGVVFQDYNLISGLSVVENAELAAMISGKKTSSNEVENELSRMGLQYGAQKAETLSGGEKQRVALLRSKWKDADVLLADEPTGNLDSENAEIVFEMLLALKHDRHVIVVTHNQELTEKYADRVIELKDGQVVRDTVKNNALRDETFHDSYERKTRSTCKHDGEVVALLGMNSIKMRRGRFLLLVLSMALSIAAGAIVFMTNAAGKRIAGEVNTNYLENDLLLLRYDNVPNTSLGRLPFTDDTIASIAGEDGVREVVKRFYETRQGSCHFQSGGKITAATVKQINLDDFFKQRVMSYNIEGGFPEVDDEIILAEDVAEMLFGKEAIGQTVVFFCEASDEVTCKVVGVNHMKNPQDQYYSFVSVELLRKMLKQQLERDATGVQMLLEYTEESTANVDVIGVKAARAVSVSGKEELLYGCYPNSSNQALISSKAFVLAMREFSIDGAYTEEDLLQQRIPEGLIENALDRKFVLNHNGVFPIVFVGIYQSEEPEYRYCDSLIEEIKQENPVGLDIYVWKPAEVEKTRQKMVTEYHCSVIAEQETLKKEVEKQSSFFSNAIVIFGGVLGLVTTAMLLAYGRLMIHERLKEIAVIKSFGAKNSLVLRVLLFDIVIISLCATFVSIGALFGAKMICARYVKELTLFGVTESIAVVMIVGLCMGVFEVAVTTVLLRKTVRQMPADLLRQH